MVTKPKPKKLEVKIKKRKRNSPGHQSTGMVAPHISKKQAEMESRMAKVSDLYLQGLRQADIAKEVGVSPTTVYNDLVTIREGWLESSVIDFDKKKAKELAKLDRLEARAWEAFQDSIGDVTTVKVKEFRVQPLSDGPDKKKGGRPRKSPPSKWIPLSQSEERTTKYSAGDPRYMDIIGKCIETRLKLMGALRNDSQTGGGGTTININWAEMYRQRPDQPEEDPVKRLIREAKEGRLIKVEAETETETETGTETADDKDPGAQGRGDE